MPRTRWRTVSCADDSLRAHPSRPKAYDWIAGQPAAARFRVQYDEQLGAGWRSYATVESTGDGMDEVF